MKNGILALMTLLAAASAGAAHAAPITSERVLKDTTTIVALELTPQTVFCTDRGYGNVQLKVSVPDLDWLAHFDHRVQGEGLPCVTGGRCTDSFHPGTIIDPNERIALAPMRVILKEALVLDRDAKTCTRALHESIEGVIRGRTFRHYGGGAPEAVDVEKCEKLIRG